MKEYWPLPLGVTWPIRDPAAVNNRTCRTAPVVIGRPVASSVTVPLIVAPGVSAKFAVAVAPGPASVIGVPRMGTSDVVQDSPHDTLS